MIAAALVLASTLIGTTPPNVNITPCGPPSYLTPRTEGELYQRFGPMYARHTMAVTSPSGQRGTMTVVKMYGAEGVLFNAPGKEPRVVELRIHRSHPNAVVSRKVAESGERGYQCSGGTTIHVKRFGSRDDITCTNWQ